MSFYRDDLALAHVLADTADSIAQRRFRAQDLNVTTKPDNSPVTDADTAIEEALRRVLHRARPRDSVLGEEQGLAGGAGRGSRQWVIDPIDGTKNFLRGVPIWATLIALVDGGEAVAGLVSAPALGRRWWAARNVGAYAGRNLNSASAIRVSGVKRLKDASVGYSELHSWGVHGRFGQFCELTRQAWRTRGYGDFYGHVLVAEGAADVMLEPDLKLWDIAALVPILTEAGGTFSDLDGKTTLLGEEAVTSAVSSNGLLHDTVLGILSR